jgi:hypothetical protein
MTHSTTTDRRAAKTATGEGEAYWFYGDKVILRSPEGALPVIIEHHVGPGAAADTRCGLLPDVHPPRRHSR